MVIFLVKMKNKMQLYSYIGSQEIFDALDFNFKSYKISNSDDVFFWIKSTSQEIINNSVIATFIIDENHNLFINDRHSEHVLCAGGRKVLSAGEILFLIDGKDISINEISNQSTGYCPKPESWKEVEYALKNIEITHPNYFTTAFDFRYCQKCKSINLIKEDFFLCQICGTDLEKEWNFDKE